ncbi:MAG: hypothetical protein H7Z43_00445 [Clostridia bacterium]|nr:hypothetical protein [Deltaproteobacteria bacterium]
MMSSARIAALLKQYGWVLNLVFIALGAYFIAGAASAVVARAIRIVPSVDEVSASLNKAPPPTRPKASLASIASRNLFGVKREDLSPKPVDEQSAGETAVVDFNGKELKPCTLSGVLSATLVSADLPEWSVAVIVSNSTHDPEVYSINPGSNAIADDATLVDIRYREVVVRRRDHFELCSTEGNVPPPVVASAPAEEGTGGGEGVTKTSDTQFEIDGAFLASQLENMNELMTQARSVPSYQNGKSNGYKLFSIKPNSLYQKIGLQNGDVISKINGYDMSSPDKALEVYAKLKDAPSIQVDVKRRGRDLSMNYNVKR